MIKLVYHTLVSEKDKELQWLRDQKIYPACHEHYDWDKEITLVSFGVIVSAETALAIKLRHNLDLQADYR